MIDISELIKQVAMQYSRAEECWMEGLITHYSPGLASLIKTGQRRAALARLKAFGYNVNIWPDGTKELKRGSQVLGRAKFVITYKV